MKPLLWVSLVVIYAVYAVELPQGRTLSRSELIEGKEFVEKEDKERPRAHAGGLFNLDVTSLTNGIKNEIHRIQRTVDRIKRKKFAEEEEEDEDTENERKDRFRSGFIPEDSSPISLPIPSGHSSSISTSSHSSSPSDSAFDLFSETPSHKSSFFSRPSPPSTISDSSLSPSMHRSLISSSISDPSSSSSLSAPSLPPADPEDPTPPPSPVKVPDFSANSPSFTSDLAEAALPSPHSSSLTSSAISAPSLTSSPISAPSRVSISPPLSSSLQPSPSDTPSDFPHPRDSLLLSSDDLKESPSTSDDSTVDWGSKSDSSLRSLEREKVDVLNSEDDDTVILFKGDKGEYCEKYEQHFSFYCVGDVDQTQQAQQMLQQFCPSFKKSCPEKAKGQTIPLTTWPANPFGKEITVNAQPDESEEEGEGEGDGEEEEVHLTKDDRFQLYIKRRVPCKPDCNPKIYPHCTEECKCDYIYPAVQKFCNPPPIPLFLNTCRLWYNGCPKYEQYHYSSQFVYSKAEKGKVVPGPQPVNPYNIPTPVKGRRAKGARTRHASSRHSQHMVIPPDPFTQQRPRSHLSRYAHDQPFASVKLRREEENREKEIRRDRALRYILRRDALQH